MYPFSSGALFSPQPATVQEKIRTAYNRAFINWQAFWVEAYRDQSFYLNNQWSPEERRYLQQEQRPDYCYNLTFPLVNMLQGYERKHRTSLIAQPVEFGDDETAEIFTKCLYHTMHHGNGHNAVSEAFKGALITGIGYIGLSMDYRFDPQNGDVQYTFYPWNSCIADPFWTKLDFSDCDYFIRRAYMSKTEAISRFPEKEEEISKMQGNMRDDLFTFLPEQRIFQSQNLLAYTEYWEQEFEEIEVVINPLTLQEIEITSKNRKDLAPLLKIDGIKHYKRQRSVIKWYALLNNEVVAEDTNPFNLNEYPFIPVICTYSPEYDLYQYKMQGIIRPIRDTQIEFNKRINKIIDSIDSQINAGWIVKKSKFDNFMDFYKSGQGRVIFAKNEADLTLDAKQIAAAPMAQGLMEMQQIMNQLTMRITAINEELLGAADDDKPGVLSMLRQGSALVAQQPLFDNLRKSKEIVGDRSMKMIQNNWTPEKIMKVTRMKPTEEFYRKDFRRYDIVTAEALLTETQRQLYFTQLMQMKQMDAPIPWTTIFKAMPMQSKAELLKDIQEAEQQQQQMQQAQAQQQMEDQAIINRLLMAESRMKIASAQEKLAKAEEDRAGANLDRARAARELELVDMDGINKFIDTIIKLEQVDRVSAEIGGQNETQTNEPGTGA